jgi:hydroxyacyl-ACP dehydratase HTD2-like protein with hotdog domain
MLLETVIHNNPDVQVERFSYRATNPLYMDKLEYIRGKWTDESKKTATLWCVDEDGRVGMTGFVELVK